MYSPCILHSRIQQISFRIFAFFSLMTCLFYLWTVDCACCRWSLSEETLAGWQEIPKNASRSTAVASGMSFLSSFWEIKWEPGMLFYNLHSFSQNSNVMKWVLISHRGYHAMLLIIWLSGSKSVVTWFQLIYGTEVTDSMLKFCWCRLFLTVNKYSPVWRKNVPARVGSRPEI
jgi:hypothetical protein